jgi:hypothetical protein
MSIEPYRTGKAGRPVRAITMEDRLRRYRVMEKVEPRMDELLANMFELAFKAESEEVRRKATKDLIEACVGKPYQAVQVDTAPEVQRTLIVRWMPPDPNDRSNVIEQEPD